MNTSEEQEYENLEFYVIAEMQRAIGRGDLRTVQWCIQENMYLKGHHGEKAVEAAAKGGKHKILYALFSGGAPATQLGLRNAIESKNLSCVKAFLQQGLVPDFASMELVVQRYHHWILKVLLSAGGSVYCTDWRSVMKTWPTPTNYREMMRQQETMNLVFKWGGIY